MNSHNDAMSASCDDPQNGPVLRFGLQNGQSGIIDIENKKALSLYFSCNYLVRLIYRDKHYTFMIELSTNMSGFL